MASLTYAAFHALFLVPPLAGLSAAVAVRSRNRPSEVRPLAVGALVVLALAYTVPWDNYLVAKGVWTYGAGAVAASLWHAPVEEYLFVVFQSLLVAAWLHLVSGAVDAPATDSSSLSPHPPGLVAAGCLGVAGVLALTGARTFYLGAILTWAAPVLALQWGVGWHYLRRRWRTLAVGVLVPTAYLSLADAVAISRGVWRISPAFSTGVTVAGLPIEEALFFLCTSTFLVQGLVLYPWVIERWR